jgi:hypothetical protein
MTFNFNIFQCFSNISNHLSSFSYLVCISCKFFIRWRFYLFLKTENSRRVPNRVRSVWAFKGAVSRRRLAKINGAKKRLKLMLHDWKRCSNLQFIKQSKDVLHNEGIKNSISYFTPNLINCWQTVFQVRAYFGCAVEPWHCPFKTL